MVVGEGGRSPLPFFINWRSALILEKNALIVSILGFISHFKCGFKSFQEKKKHIFSLRGFSFMCCRSNVYRRALILRRLPCPEKFLVTRLKPYHILISEKGRTRIVNSLFNAKLRPATIDLAHLLKITLPTHFSGSGRLNNKASLSKTRKHLKIRRRNLHVFYRMSVLKKSKMFKKNIYVGVLLR